MSPRQCRECRDATTHGRVSRCRQQRRSIQGGTLAAFAFLASKVPRIPLPFSQSAPHEPKEAFPVPRLLTLVPPLITKEAGRNDVVSADPTLGMGEKMLRGTSEFSEIPSGDSVASGELETVFKPRSASLDRCSAAGGKLLAVSQLRPPKWSRTTSRASGSERGARPGKVEGGK